MSDMADALDRYLMLRRGLGFRLRSTEFVLRNFVRHLDRVGAEFITNELAVQWVTRGCHLNPTTASGNLGKIRQFAKNLAAFDPRTQIPPTGLLSCRPNRKSYIYSPEQIGRILWAARMLHPFNDGGFRRWTLSTFFGLLAVTGMRLSEGIELSREDVDLTNGVLRVRDAKFGKTRFVPIHPSTEKVLRDYARRRDQFFVFKPSAPNFFLSEKGTKLNANNLERNFVRLSRRIGLRGRFDSHGPRIHDLRHTFAVRTVINWYKAGLNIDCEMPKLATFLGHGHIADTYWYLSAVPELLTLAKDRLERAHEERPKCVG